MCAIRRKKHFINISRKKSIFYFLIWRADKIPKMFAFLKLLETDFVIRQKFFDKLQQRLFFLWLQTRKSQFQYFCSNSLKERRRKQWNGKKNKSQMLWDQNGTKAKLLHNIFWIRFWWDFFEISDKSNLAKCNCSLLTLVKQRTNIHSLIYCYSTRAPKT